MANEVSLRAFINIQSLMSAVPGVVSTLGEISPISLTYSVSKAEYTSALAQGYRLISISCLSTTTSLETSVPQYITDLSLELIGAALTYASTNITPFVVQNFIDAMTVAGNGSAGNVTVGNFITQTNATTLPEWISFTYTPDGSTIRLWTCDASFQAEYDLFSIVIIPPITPLDNFFQPPVTVQTDLNAVTVTDFFDNIQAARNYNPETFLEYYNFNYISPVLGTLPMPTNWAALVYGLQGDNIDTIKDAIVAYITANTAQPISSWESIFPQIFQRTEFIIVPRWDVFSVPNMTTIAGLYKSMTNVQDDINFATANASFYTPAFIDQNLIVTSSYYKYISLLIINGDNNATGETDIRTLFPDYIPQSSDSLDFNRMTPTTQTWSNLLVSMLETAETMTAYSTLPPNMRRIYRNKVMLLAALYNNVDYIMIPIISMVTLASSTLAP